MCTLQAVVMLCFIFDEESFLKADKSTRYKRGIIAGWINQVRLIDNMQVSFTS